MVLPGAAPPGRAATSLTAQKFSWNKKHRLAIVNGTTAPSLLRLRQHVEQEFHRPGTTGEKCAKTTCKSEQWRRRVLCKT